MTFYPLRAKTHLRYAQRLMAEATEAEHLGHEAQSVQKCREVSEHALKAIFDITGIDFEKYNNLEEAAAKGLKMVFDKATLGQLKDHYLVLKSPGHEEVRPRECIEKASFLLKKAMELFGK